MLVLSLKNKHYINTLAQMQANNHIHCMSAQLYSEIDNVLQNVHPHIIFVLNAAMHYATYQRKKNALISCIECLLVCGVRSYVIVYNNDPHNFNKSNDIQVIPDIEYNKEFFGHRLSSVDIRHEHISRETNSGIYYYDPSFALYVSRYIVEKSKNKKAGIILFPGSRNVEDLSQDFCCEEIEKRMYDVRKEVNALHKSGSVVVIISQYPVYGCNFDKCLRLHYYYNSYEIEKMILQTTNLFFGGVIEAPNNHMLFANILYDFQKKDIIEFQKFITQRSSNNPSILKGLLFIALPYYRSINALSMSNEHNKWIRCLPDNAAEALEKFKIAQFVGISLKKLYEEEKKDENNNELYVVLDGFTYKNNIIKIFQSSKTQNRIILRDFAQSIRIVNTDAKYVGIPWSSVVHDPLLLGSLVTMQNRIIRKLPDNCMINLVWAIVTHATQVPEVQAFYNQIKDNNAEIMVPWLNNFSNAICSDITFHANHLDILKILYGTIDRFHVLDKMQRLISFWYVVCKVDLVITKNEKYCNANFKLNELRHEKIIFCRRNLKMLNFIKENKQVMALILGIPLVILNRIIHNKSVANAVRDSNKYIIDEMANDWADEWAIPDLQLLEQVYPKIDLTLKSNNIVISNTMAFLNKLIKIVESKCCSLCFEIVTLDKIITAVCTNEKCHAILCILCARSCI